MKTILALAALLLSACGGGAVPATGDADILLLGDSVVEAVAVPEPQRAYSLLAQQTGLTVVSQARGGWSPQDCLAELQRLGTQGATRAFYVVNTHDAGQAPGTVYADPNGPVRPESMQAIADILAILRAAGVEVTLLLHKEAGYTEDREMDKAILLLEPGLTRLYFVPADYSDFIHLNEQGQASLAAQITGAL